MSYTCQHCGEEPESVSRTGERRYSCDACSKVVTYDNLAPHLDELEVIDKRDQVGKNKEDESNKDSSTEKQEAQQQEQNVSNQEPAGGLDERELIRQRGQEGLKEVKKERLKHWLSVTDNVGSTTESRVVMVFDSDQSYRENPNALYNLLDDELSSSSSYINTIVNQVFQPEHEHADLLEQNGYMPYFENNNAAQGRQQMSNQNNNQQGFQPTNPAPQKQSEPQQQQPSPEPSSSGDSLTKQDMMEVMSAANQQQESSGRQFGDAASEGLNQATEEAIKNMANNMGGFLQAGQEMIREALVEYAKENPEVVVENMDIFQSFLNSNDGGSEPEPSQQDMKVDNAVQQTQQASQQQSQQRQQPQQRQQTQQQPTQQQQMGESQLRDPRRNPEDSTDNELGVNKEEHMTSDSGFEPDEEILNKDETDKEQQSEPTQNNDRNRSSNNSDSNDGSEEDEETFDELFGDIADQ